MLWEKGEQNQEGERGHPLSLKENRKEEHYETETRVQWDKELGIRGSGHRVSLGEILQEDDA